MTWTNPDKLVVKFGTEESTLSNISADTGENAFRFVEIIANWADLPAVASNGVIIDSAFVLDSGVLIEGVSIKKSVDFDSTSDDMTLSIGCVDVDGTSNYTKAAFVDAATQVELNTLADGIENYSGWVGSLVGTVTTKKLKFMWEVDAHAAIAGQAVIRIKWSVPPPSGNTLVWSKP